MWINLSHRSISLSTSPGETTVLPLSARRGFSIDSLENDKDFPSFLNLKSGERTAEEFKEEHRKVSSSSPECNVKPESGVKSAFLFQSRSRSMPSNLGNFDPSMSFVCPREPVPFVSSRSTCRIFRGKLKIRDNSCGRGPVLSGRDGGIVSNQGGDRQSAFQIEISMPVFFSKNVSLSLRRGCIRIHMRYAGMA